ncbi:MAG TPA: hypothetical protein VFZ48_01365 [Candidatus Saccharimonadales bacterium]
MRLVAAEVRSEDSSMSTFKLKTAKKNSITVRGSLFLAFAVSTSQMKKFRELSGGQPTVADPTDGPSVAYTVMSGMDVTTRLEPNVAQRYFNTTDVDDLINLVQKRIEQMLK